MNRILIFVSEAAGTAGTGFRPGVGVNSELKTQRVNVIGQRLDAVRKPLRVGDDVCLGVA